VPIPEVEAAADLLIQAADRLLAYDRAKARSYLEQDLQQSRYWEAEAVQRF
jgi:hypothetical protein